MAKRILIAQAVLVGAVALGMALREFPGLVREVRIWRMSGSRSGARLG